MRPASSAPSTIKAGLPLAWAAPGLIFLVLAMPILSGFAGTLLPAFGYLPGLGGNELTLSHFRDLAGVPGIGRSVATSIGIGLATTLASTCLVAGFAGAHLGTPAFAHIRRVISPLLAVPHAAVAFGLIYLIAPSGFLMRLASIWITGSDRPPDLLIIHDPMGLAMMAGLIIKEVPFLFLIALAALPQINHSQAIRLGRSFGYGRIAAFLFLVWPQIYRQIRLGVFAVLAYATSVVDVAIILGPQLPATLPVRLIEWITDPDLSRRYLASAGALLQLGATLSALLVWLGFEKLGALLLDAARQDGRRLTHDGMVRHLAWIAMALIAGSVFAGISLLGVWSIAGLWQFPDPFPDMLTLKSWMRALPQIGHPLVTTLIVATSTTLIAIVLCVLLLERERETGHGRERRWLPLIYLPLIMPQISFMFGLQYLAILTGVDAGYFGLITVHLVFVLPYVFLSLSEPWRAQDPRYDAIAAGLGMSRVRALTFIRLPMLGRALMTAAAVGFAVSVGQYLPTLLIGAGRLTTITTEAVALAAGGNRRVIGVYAFLQTLLPFFAFTIATLAPGLLWRNRRGLAV